MQTPSFDVVTVGSLFVEITPTMPGESLTTARRYTLVAGGAAANTVFALARLGVHVGFITAVGDDEFGTLATEEMAAFGVETAGIRRVCGQLTPVTFAAIDGKGGKQFHFYRFPGYCAPMEALTAEDFQPVTQSGLFDFSEGSIREPALRALVFNAARNARAAGIPVLYAVNLRRGSWGLPDDAIRAVEREAVALADIVVLNDEEADFIIGATPGASGEACATVLHALGARVVVITRGGDGNMLVSVDGQSVPVPPYRVPVVYDVGAGDTFHAGLATAALRGGILGMDLLAWAQAVRFAAAVAAIRVSTSADPHDLPGYDAVVRWMAG